MDSENYMSPPWDDDDDARREAEQIAFSGNDGRIWASGPSWKITDIAARLRAEGFGVRDVDDVDSEDGLQAGDNLCLCPAADDNSWLFLISGTDDQTGVALLHHAFLEERDDPWPEEN